MAWVAKKFPNLSPEIKWNQPMFTDHGTYIIGISVSKHHLAVAPERAGMIHCSDEIVQAGYDHTKESRLTVQLFGGNRKISSS